MNILNLDSKFLDQVNQQQTKFFYAKIILLNANDDPVEEIQGRITGGSINIDGTSAVRRTCNLSMVAAEANFNDYLWTLKAKFKLEIGIANLLTNQYSPFSGKYPKIVWHNMGIFILTSFNTSFQINGISISLSGKDKMCMLNGELGGQLFASVDFGSEETIEYKLRPVEFQEFPSDSSVLMSKNYYILKNDDDDIETNAEYVFEQNNNEGNWFRLGTNYIYDNQNSRQYNGKHYKRYKRLSQPNEAFIENNSNLVVPYYYKQSSQEDSQYFIQNTINNSDLNEYIIGELYELEEKYAIKKIPLEKIIREAIHAFAQEPYHNILISDLENYGLEQIMWRGDQPLVAYRQLNVGYFTQIDLYDRFLEQVSIENFTWDSLTPELLNNLPSVIKVDGQEIRRLSSSDPIDDNCYTVAKIESNQDIGYRVTELVYDGDLVTSIGETLTSVLDKIKNMLGDFEYFYNTDGQFIFRRKPIFVNTSWSHFVNNKDEKYVTFSNDLEKYSFNFEGNALLTSIQNTPVLTNLRNDFIVWGKRKGIDGKEYPIHARYAIDKKPEYYKALNGKIYTTNLEVAKRQNSEIFSNPDNLLINIDSLAQLQEIKHILSHFTPSHLAEIQGLHLKTPDWNADTHTWSPGWWDIRDWAEYYTALTGKSLEDLGTMQFFSSNDEHGFVEMQGHQVWLLEYNSNGELTFNHNKYVYNEDETIEKTYHVSTYNNGTLITKATDIVKDMHYPYAYCNEDHTYYFFLQNIEKDGYNYYFYNPNFLSGKQNEQLLLNFIYNINIVDWREIIYQMALDYFAAQGCSEQNPLYISNENLVIGGNALVEMVNPDSFLAEIKKRNPYLYPMGKTGYEQYYTDIQGYWRELYNPEYISTKKYISGYYTDAIEKKENSAFYSRVKIWHDETIEETKDFYTLEDGIEKAGWNKNVFLNPEQLNFWFDFLDDESELKPFSIPLVGDRQKVVHDDKISAIIYKEIPTVVFFDTSDNTAIQPTREVLNFTTGYTRITIPPGFSKYLSMSYRGISAKNKIDELIYQFAYCVENISLTSIPVYEIQPNTLISVFDTQSNINGEYIVNKITYSLNYNGTMNISATKSPHSQPKVMQSNYKLAQYTFEPWNSEETITLGELINENSVFIKEGDVFKQVPREYINTELVVQIPPKENGESIENNNYEHYATVENDGFIYELQMDEESTDNLTPSNIKNDIYLLGVTGELSEFDLSRLTNVSETATLPQLNNESNE